MCCLLVCMTEELKPKNAKRMRVQHTINISAKLPKTYNVQSQLETKMLAYVQVRQSCTGICGIFTIQVLEFRLLFRLND